MNDDVKTVLRRLGRRPIHALSIVGTLAIGLGGALAVIGIAGPTLFQPLPYLNPGRLIAVTSKLPVPTLPEMGFSDVGYRRTVTDNRTLAGAAAYTTWGMNLASGGNASRATVGRVSASFFDVLGVKPLIGRTMSMSEDMPGAGNVAVLSESMWRSAFAADPTALGKTILLDDEPYVVIGVMPASVALPSNRVHVWTPLALDPAAVNPFNRNLTVIARLRDGAGLEAARADLSSISRDVGKTYAGPHAGSKLDPSVIQAVVRPLRDTLIGDARPTMLLLLVGVLLVLALTCANVVNLQLASLLSRRTEMSIRAALGASRARLVAGAALEGVVLAGLGMAFGLVFSALSSGVLRTLTPRGLAPVATTVGAVRQVGIAVVLVAVVAAIVGVVPTALATGRDLAGSLRDRAGASVGHISTRLRGWLAAGQVSLAVLLLYGAGLMLASVRAVQRVDLGFHTDSSVAFRLDLPQARYSTRQTIDPLVQTVLMSLRAIPGVSSAAAASALPLSAQRNETMMAVEGRPFKADGTDPNADLRIVSADYFRAMGIDVVRGRTFAETDARSGYTPVVISRALAKQLFPDGSDPIGHRVRLGPFADWLPIVAVVNDAKNRSVTEDARPEIYQPAVGNTALTRPQTVFSFVARGAGDAEATLRTIRAAVRQIDPTLPVFDAGPMANVVSATRTRQDVTARLIGAFAVVALLLAVAGTYAVLAFLVSDRRREIAIRMAMGANASNVIGMVMGQTGRVVGAGGVVGLAGAVLAARGLESFLFGVTTLSPSVLVTVVGVIVAAGSVAALVPARRACLVDATLALREE